MCFHVYVDFRTKTNSISTEDPDPLSMFPPQNEFDLIPWNTASPSPITNQDDAFLSPETTTIDSNFHPLNIPK